METTEEKSRFIIWVTFSILAYMLAILQIYGIYRLYSIKDLLIVQKRYPQMVFFEASCVVISMLISQPFTLQNLLRVEYFGEYSAIFLRSIFFTYPYLQHAIANTEAARLWLVYFDLNYLHSLKNESWKSIINIKQKNDDWFLKNKKKYGNKRWVIIRVFIYYFIAASTSCILWNIFGTTHGTHFIDGCLYGLPLMLIVYVYYKSPKQSKDYFLLQYEFKTSAIIIVIAMSVYLSAQFVYFFNLYASDLMTVSISHTPAILSLTSTMWMTHKILSKSHSNGKLIWKRSGAGKQNVIADIAPQKALISPKKALIDTLKNEADLEAFVDHLSHEFSSEVVLSFIEFVQYKKYFRRICDNQYDEFETSRSKSYDLNDTLPKSSIVYGVVDKPFKDDEEMIIHIKNSAYLLYTKYIVVGCDLEINISSRLRNTYNEKMNDYDIWIHEDNELSISELINIFDPIIDQMFQLMTQSFARYTYNI